MSITLEEAIKHAAEVAAYCDEHCAEDHWQLVKWLEELQIRRFKEAAEPEHDAVHSPKHYMIPGTGLEVIDVIEGILTPEQRCGYYYGNIIKYILRAPNKNGVEDLRKAAVYLEWLTLSLDDQQYEEAKKWIQTAQRKPDAPTGPKRYWFRGEDVAADEYIVMIEGADKPTALLWNGRYWFDEHNGQTFRVFAWRPLPDPPSWKEVTDPDFTPDDLPFPEVTP